MVFVPEVMVNIVFTLISLVFLKYSLSSVFS